MRVVLWGTYDTGKPRTRILRAAPSEAGVDVLEIHADVWSGIEDKSQVTGLGSRLKFLLAWLGSYPQLLLRYIRAPKHDAVIVGYLGHLDVLVLWPLARLKSKPIVWDAFLSLYDTVVVDRKLVGPKHRHHRGVAQGVMVLHRGLLSWVNSLLPQEFSQIQSPDACLV